MQEDQRYIGVFDSGIGGLTVARQLIKHLPKERIIYFGDTARVPYGIKSKQTVIKFTTECINFLLNSFKLKAVVIACNTASSYALSGLESNLDIPVFGVIDPGVRKAIATTQNKKIGVIGTRATINSKAYRKRILNLDQSIEVFEESCPLFVPLVEEGWLEDSITYTIAERYLKNLKDASIDTLILGCTHYPVLKNVIADVMGQSVSLIDSAEEVASIIKNELGNINMLSNQSLCRNKFFVTDEFKRFIEIGKIFFEDDLDEVARVDLFENKVMDKV